MLRSLTELEGAGGGLGREAGPQKTEGGGEAGEWKLGGENRTGEIQIGRRKWIGR